MKRSVTIAGHRTSVWVEAPFWDALAEIADERETTVSALVAEIDAGRRDDGNLSSAIRIFVLAHYRGRTGSGA